MVVNRDRQHLFCALLANDVLIQCPHDFLRLRQFGGERLLPALHVLRDDVVAEVHALIADVNGGSRDQFLDLFAALAAEGTS